MGGAEAEGGGAGGKKAPNYKRAASNLPEQEKLVRIGSLRQISHLLNEEKRKRFILKQHFNSTYR